MLWRSQREVIDAALYVVMLPMIFSIGGSLDAEERAPTRDAQRTVV